MSKKKVLSVDICGTCYERFEGADPQESAAKLKAHYLEKHPLELSL